MTYPDRSGSQLTDPTIVNPLVDYHDQVRWGQFWQELRSLWALN
ncbi:hypothetical protein [Microcoleus sp. N9_B4]